MRWHLELRCGDDDEYLAPVREDEAYLRAAIEVSKGVQPYIVQQHVLAEILKSCGRLPPAACVDLLSIAIAVFAADLRVPRFRTKDRWTRDVVLHVPVWQLPVWEAVSVELAELMKFLTGDVWLFRFRQRAGTQPVYSTGRVEDQTGLAEVRTVALFSGGLDSLVGAINLLEDGTPVALVGQYGPGVTNSFQQEVLSAVQQHESYDARPFRFHVHPGKVHPAETEQSMRSRSFLFLALGVAVASALESAHRLVVTENGFISLNVPLTYARAGSRSTRTTHPHFIGAFQRLLEALNVAVSVELPALYQTKGELLASVRNRALLAATAPLTMSCSHPEAGRFQGRSPRTHCGYCVPCIVRRAATSFAKVADADYDHDLLSPTLQLSETTRSDLRAFEIAIARHGRMSSLQRLTTVLSTGPLAPEHAAEHAAVHYRGLEEVAAFLSLRRQ